MNYLFFIFSNGSVIAVFNVSYRVMDSLQILAVQENLADKYLGNLPAELLGIVTDNGKP